MMEGKHAKNRGFSLIEVLFAFIITSALILGTAQLTMESLLCSTGSELRLGATELLFSKLETIKSLPFTRPDLDDGDHSERIEDTTSGKAFICNWTVQTLSSNLKSVEMECIPENAPEKKNRLILFLSIGLGF